MWSVLAALSLCWHIIAGRIKPCPWSLLDSVLCTLFLGDFNLFPVAAKKNHNHEYCSLSEFFKSQQIIKTKSGLGGPQIQDQRLFSLKVKWSDRWIRLAIYKLANFFSISWSILSTIPIYLSLHTSTYMHLCITAHGSTDIHIIMPWKRRPLFFIFYVSSPLNGKSR